jgi:outer membrane receptor protein involved in Fe transport
MFEIPTTLRSNPNLQPEDSRSFSGGLVYTPRYLPGLTLTVDLFDIESTGRVNSSPDVQDLIFRDAAGKLLPTEEVNRDPNGSISSISLAYENGGSQKARGIDFALQCQVPTSLGTFTSLTHATYFDSFQFAPLPGEPERELVGSDLAFGADEGYLKWRANSTFEWVWRGLDLATTAHYLDGFHEHTNSGRIHYVKQTWFFDVQGSYRLSFDEVTDSWKRMLNRATVTLGCTNVFGHDPPRANTNTGYADFTYDSTGRFLYVSLKKEL